MATPDVTQPGFFAFWLDRLREPVFVAQLGATVGFFATVFGWKISPDDVAAFVAAALGWYGAAALVARSAVAAIRNLRERF